MSTKDWIQTTVAAILLVFVCIFVADFLVALNLPEPYDVYIAVAVLGAVAATGAYFFNWLSQRRR